MASVSVFSLSGQVYIPPWRRQNTKRIKRFERHKAADINCFWWKIVSEIRHTPPNHQLTSSHSTSCLAPSASLCCITSENLNNYPVIHSVPHSPLVSSFMNFIKSQNETTSFAPKPSFSLLWVFASWWKFCGRTGTEPPLIPLVQPCSVMLCFTFTLHAEKQ